MIRTNSELVQEIIFEVYSGFPSNVQRLDERFVLRKINEVKAHIAKVNAFESNNAEGITVPDGSFYKHYTGLTLVADTVFNGLKYVVLPAMPVGLPRVRSIIVSPPAATGGLKSGKFRPIHISEIQLINSLPSVPNTIFYCQADDRLLFASKENALINAYTTVNAMIVTSGGVDMDDTINMSDDSIFALKQIVIPQLKAFLMQPQDVLNDGLDKIPVGQT